MIELLKDKVRTCLDKNLPVINLDIALRYVPVVESVEKLGIPDPKILEVGSGNTGITDFLKQKVFSIDITYDAEKTDKVIPSIGSVTCLPFRDEEFDYVISMDMLEHVPPSLREKAVAEMIRVTSQKAFIGFPCGEKAENHDRKLDRMYKKHHGEDFFFLEEHIRNGLPGDEEFVEYLEKIKKNEERKMLFENKKNVNLFLHYLLACFWMSPSAYVQAFYRRVGPIFMFLLKRMNFGNCYREIYEVTLSKNNISG